MIRYIYLVSHVHYSKILLAAFSKQKIYESNAKLGNDFIVDLIDDEICYIIKEELVEKESNLKAKYIYVLVDFNSNVVIDIAFKRQTILGRNNMMYKVIKKVEFIG